MKNKLLFTTLIILLLGCSKKDSINASDQYVGTYVTTVQIITRGSSKTTSTTATISFKSSGNGLILTDTWGDHHISMDGPEFTLTYHSVPESILGVKDIYMRNGMGKFDGNSVTLTTYTVSDGTYITAVYTGTKN